MAKFTTEIDTFAAMKNITVTVRYTRFTEWKLRSWLGLQLIRFGVWLTGMKIVLKAE